MTITEKAAYLRGLVEGQGLDPEAGEGKLWHVLSELVGDLAAEMNHLQENQEDLENSVEEVQVGLDYLEELLQEDYDEREDFEDEEDEYYPFGDGKFRIVDDDSEEEDLTDEEDASGVYYEVECPNCGEEISFDDETLEEGSIICPNCGAALEFDLRESEDDEAQQDDAGPEENSTSED